MHKGSDLEARARNMDYDTSWGSNGQQSTLRYFLCIGAMACQVYSDDSLRIIMFDEAGAHIDVKNTQSFIGMLRDTKVQAVMFTERNHLDPYMDMIYKMITDTEGPYKHILRIIPAVRKQTAEAI